MRRKKRQSATLATGFVLALAGLTLSAAPAMADVPASWVQVTKGTYPSGQVSAPSAITVYKDGGSATSCTQSGANESMVLKNGESAGFSPLGTIGFTCTGGKTFTMLFGVQSASFGTSYNVQGFTGTIGFASPWGNYAGSGETFTAPFTNGSGKTLSTITLSKVWVGTTYSTLHKITVSGSFRPSLGASGLLTLTH